MLGRTLLYTAITRARQLVVLVGQARALRLAVRDWRREPRHTALEGLLAGALHFDWRRGSVEGGGEVNAADQPLWESLLGGAFAGEL
jgi:hypothetical protein